MMNAGDTGFMMICTAFVFFMTPGLAFFYGGLVRRKNVVNTMMACGAIMGLSVVMWTLFGYSLAFGGNHGGIIGDFRWFALNGVGWEPGPYADTIPHLVFVAFQMMFAMITPALITSTIFSFMWRWDDFLGALLYVNKTEKYPVSLALKMFCDPSSSSDYGAMFAMATLSILPAVLIFFCLQRYLVEGISTSGLKG